MNISSPFEKKNTRNLFTIVNNNNVDMCFVDKKELLMNLILQLAFYKISDCRLLQ